MYRHCMTSLKRRTVLHIVGYCCQNVKSLRYSCWRKWRHTQLYIKSKIRKEFAEHHVRNFENCIDDASHDHGSPSPRLWPKWRMGKWDQGNGSWQADHLPGNRLVTSYRLYWGKRWVFNRDRKPEVDLVLRIDSGREFQMVGAENEKYLRPMTLLMLGTQVN